MIYQAIVFDFDGVLADTNRIKQEGYIEGLRPVKQPGFLEEANRDQLTLDTLDAMRGQDRYSIIPVLQKRGLLIDLPLEDLIKLYNDYCEDRSVVAAEVPGARMMLEKLYGVRELSVNSATPDEVLKRVISRRNWSHYFKKVLGSSGSKGANLESIAREGGWSPGQMLFVGDAPSDHEAALSFGCDFLGVANESNDFEERGNRGEMRLVRDLRMLPEIV